MAVYMNAKGSTNSSFQIGKRGNKIFGGTTTPSTGDVSTGDLWLDNSNSVIRIASVTSSGGSTDSYWSNVILLLNADDGSITDDSGTTTTLTLQGNTTISTSVKKYGSGSMAFDGDGDYIQIVSNTALGTDTFTIETWMYATDVTPTGNFPIISNDGGFQLDIGSNGKIRFKDGSGVDIRSGTSAVSANTWHHIAVVREGTGTNETTLYIDGSSVDTGTCATNYSDPDYFVTQSKGDNATEWLNGYLDDVRITKGVARYTSNFTAPSGAFPTSSTSSNTVTWANVVQAGSSVSLDDLTVSGNLTVSGTTTTINTQTLNVEDNIIVLNSNFSGADNVVDAGIEVERGDETNVQFIWDESEGEWTLGSEILSAGGFTGNVTGDLTGSVRPNGGPNSVTANTITTSGTLNVTGATITGANTTSISEGSNLYYTDERVDDRVGAIMAGSGAATVTYDDANATITVGVSGLGVDDFSGTNYDATGDTWSDDDSTFATTAAIADRIEAQISSDANVVHTTGNETITGNKTINNSTFALAANSTLDVSNATITGANTDSISEGSTNLYFTNPRARQAIQVSDSSGQLSYSNATGIITFTDAGSSAGGSNTQVQFNDDGTSAGDPDFVFDKSTNRLTVTNLTVDSNFNITSDYGAVSEAVTVTDSFGFVSNDTRQPTPHDSYTVSEAGSITGMNAGDMIFVSDETGGATMAFYDGTNWRRVQDRAVIS